MAISGTDDGCQDEIMDVFATAAETDREDCHSSIGVLNVPYKGIAHSFTGDDAKILETLLSVESISATLPPTTPISRFSLSGTTHDAGYHLRFQHQIEETLRALAQNSLPAEKTLCVPHLGCTLAPVIIIKKEEEEEHHHYHRTEERNEDPSMRILAGYHLRSLASPATAPLLTALAIVAEEEEDEEEEEEIDKIMSEDDNWTPSPSSSSLSPSGGPTPSTSTSDISDCSKPSSHRSGDDASSTGTGSGSGMHGCRTSSDISYAEVRGVFHLTITEAAEKLGVGCTTLKKMCRKFDPPIMRWPQRNYNSLLEMKKCLLAPNCRLITLGVKEMRKTLLTIEKALTTCMLTEPLKRLRQQMFKKQFMMNKQKKKGLGRRGRGGGRAARKK